MAVNKQKKGLQFFRPLVSNGVYHSFEYDLNAIEFFMRVRA